MKRGKVILFKQVFAIAGVMVSLLPSMSWSDAQLIREVETLRNSLPMKDPSRGALTLRLADRVFDHAGELAKNPAPTDQQVKEIDKYRKRALALYNEALSGSNGAFQAPQGPLKAKLQFQVARLQSDLGETQAALNTWRVLAAQQDVLEIRREASLRLAENAENSESAGSVQEAMKHYDAAFSLCAGGDICSFVRYRKAWLFHRLNQHPQALAEMKQALWDSRGQLREESLRDYMVFWSKTPSTGQDAFEEWDALSTKLNRPKLLNELADAFYAAGNKPAGTFVLENFNARSPSRKNQVRLLEEYYGSRSWDSFRSMLETLAQNQSAMPADEAGATESEKILHRLTVQLDGERVTQPRAAEDFKSTVETYLAWFPTNTKRLAMQEGWLAAETDDTKKVSRLATWIKQPESSGSIQRLRELRLNSAQKSKQQDVVIAETAALAAFAQAQPSAKVPASKLREYKYIGARARYELKDYAAALPVFQELAQPSGSGEVGSEAYSIESQNLALDILSQQKRYGDLVKQTQVWVGAKKAAPAASKDLEDIRKVQKEARFQLAAQSGETPDALENFLTFCAAGELKPQSCDNAKVLAVKLKDQTALLRVLELQGAESDLAAELEAAGFFARSAAMQEKLSKQAPTPESDLRLAVLYEIDGDLKNRDRLIARATQEAYKASSIAQEDLLYATLRESDLLKAQDLRGPWSATKKLVILERLELQGRGTPETRKMIFDSKTSSGPTWIKMQIQEARKLDTEQRKIAFYGKGGQKKFETRLAALKKLSTFLDQKLEGADSDTRMTLLGIGHRGYRDLSEEVLKSPLPDGLNEEAIAQVKNSLQELAAPFQQKAAAYEALATTESQKGGKMAYFGGVTDQLSVAAAAPARDASASGSVSEADLKAARAAIAKDPNNRSALKTLENYYSQQQKFRLAGYFKGRQESKQ
jgi:hypothetical protein